MTDGLGLVIVAAICVVWNGSLFSLVRIFILPDRRRWYLLVLPVAGFFSTISLQLGYWGIHGFPMQFASIALITVFFYSLGIGIVIGMPFILMRKEKKVSQATH